MTKEEILNKLDILIGEAIDDSIDENCYDLLDMICLVYFCFFSNSSMENLLIKKNLPLLNMYYMILNAYEQLEWCTGKENTHHAIKTGLRNNKGENHPQYGKHCSEETKKKLSEANSGEKHPMFGKKRPGDKSGYHVLSEEKVLNIRFLLRKGILQKDIAKIYKVDPSIISNINTGKTWNHIQIKKENENEK